jgi:hypothetical protein
MADALEELDRGITRHLNRRQIVAAEQKLSEAGVLAEKLFKEFPKSRRLDGELRIKLAYLASLRNELGKLQYEVYDQLRPLPGGDARLLLKTEVPQSLYVRVMTTNPSRNPGRAFPVDSVSWIDAREFCLRLSWVLGASVCLPTLDTFEAALGGEGGGEVWSNANSQGRSNEVGRHKPNAAGFGDLLGNLAEWADADATSDQAPVIGGSYLDDAQVLKTLRTESLMKSDRARHVGFRVLVEP